MGWGRVGREGVSSQAEISGLLLWVLRPICPRCWAGQTGASGVLGEAEEWSWVAERHGEELGVLV